MLARRVSVPLLLVLGCACAGGGDDGQQAALWSAQDAAEPRRIVATAWDTVASFGGVGSEELADLWLIATAPGRVYIFDNLDQRLHAFTDSLTPLWVFGAKGSGPGEFQMVRSLGVDKFGNVVLLDAGLRRISVVAASGMLRYSTNLQRPAEQAVPIGRDSFVVFDEHEDESILRIVDSSGTSRSTIAMPWEGYTKLDRLVRAGVYLQGIGSSTWVVAFSNGNGWFAFTGSTPHPFVGKYIEHTTFPVIETTRDSRVMVQPEYSAQSLSVSDSVLHVLFAGNGDDAYRLIDEYRLQDGSYRGTMLLPKRVAGIAEQRGDVYVVFNSPYPTVQRLHPKAALEETSLR